MLFGLIDIFYHPSLLNKVKSILLNKSHHDRKWILITVVILFTNSLISQSSEEKYVNKANTIDSTIANLYGVISGEIGETRDWDLMRYLFHPDTKLIPSAKNKDGLVSAKYMTVDEYIEYSGKWLVENGFFEKEIHRVENTFGNITQVFSTYESYHSENDEQPFMRGINSIQLLNDGNRWWIINIYWTPETPEIPIPKEYLPAN